MPVSLKFRKLPWLSSRIEAGSLMKYKSSNYLQLAVIEVKLYFREREWRCNRKIQWLVLETKTIPIIIWSTLMSGSPWQSQETNTISPLVPSIIRAEGALCLFLDLKSSTHLKEVKTGGLRQKGSRKWMKIWKWLASIPMHFKPSLKNKILFLNRK